MEHARASEHSQIVLLSQQSNNEVFRLNDHLSMRPLSDFNKFNRRARCLGVGDEVEALSDFEDHHEKGSRGVVVEVDDVTIPTTSPT